CLAWTRFWVNELKVQGITEISPTTIKILPPAGETGFLIRDWQFLGNGTSGDLTHPYLGTFVWVPPDAPRHSSPTSISGNYYTFDPLRSDFQYGGGLAQGANALFGDGHLNPAADFNMHFVVSLNNRIYDPSYGKDFSTLGQWE